jgi:hypothetical protein
VGFRVLLAVDDGDICQLVFSECGINAGELCTECCGRFLVGGITDDGDFLRNAKGLMMRICGLCTE